MGWLSEGVAAGGFEVVLVAAGLAVVMAAGSLGRVIVFFVIVLVLVAGGLTVVAVRVGVNSFLSIPNSSPIPFYQFLSEFQFL